MPQPRFDHITLWPVAGLSNSGLSKGLSKGLTSGTGEDKIMLSPRLHVAMEAGKGSVKACVDPKRDDALDVTITTGDHPPAFVEMGWTRRGRRLAAYSHMILHLTASSPTFNTITPAFRLHSGNRFRDVFAPAPVCTTPEPQFHECRISLTPAALEAASRLDLMLFFAPHAGQVTLHDFSLTALQ